MSSGVRERLRELVCEVLQFEASRLDEDLCRDAVESWDSVTHLRLIMDIEEMFGITLDYEIAAELQSLSQIEAAVSVQLARSGEPE